VFVLYLCRLRYMRRTRSTIQVAVALMEQPEGRYWGYDLSKRSGLRSGVLYPILHRMLNEGWLSDGWESLEAPTHRRPPRRYYELTDAGKRELGGLLGEIRAEKRFDVLAGEFA
jgi:PadR family transcriptional regulator, regulatory protein PadR